MRERERSAAAHTCPDRGSNPPPLGVPDNAPTKPHQPALFSELLGRSLFSLSTFYIVTKEFLDL